MPWPTQLAYQEAIAFPHHCFTDPDLAAATVANRALLGLPLPITGHYANVYQLVGAAQTWAVRLFLRDDPLRAVRYRTLSAHLAALSPLPACLALPDYQPAGLRLAEGDFPLLKLAWKDGILLNQWVEKHLNDAERLRALAEHWRGVLQTLHAAQIVHGDLQHGNILVTDSGQIHLIDYDGMSVPALNLAPVTELGHPSFQHPKRTEKDRGAPIDRFSGLAIYVALHALAVAPELWYRLDNGDNLLFRREDFADPTTSRAFALLREYRPLRPLAATLEDACLGPLGLISARALEAARPG